MVIGGGKGSGFNPDEPRDEHGRWTGGGALPWQDNKLKDRSALGRAAVLAGYAYVHLPDRVGPRTGWPDETASARLARLIGSWNDAGDIHDDAFRERYLGRRVSVTATRHLRAAASMAANASTS